MAQGVNAMGLTAIDLGLRGAVSGVFLLIIVVALMRRATGQQALLGMAMAAGGMFYAIATAPFFPKSSWWWVLPILSAQPAVFWLWARAAFDDDFVLRRWHGVLWLAIVAFGFVLTLGWTSWPAMATAGGKGLSLLALALALAATVQTVKTWRADLVARRRRLRLAMLAVNAGLIAAVAGAGFAAIPVAVPGAPAACKLPLVCSWWPCSPAQEFSARRRPWQSTTPRQRSRPATPAVSRGDPLVPPRQGSSSTRCCSAASII